MSNTGITPPQHPWNKIDSQWIHSQASWQAALVLSSVASFISCLHISQHLLYYTMPGIQKYVIRILILCPIYAISSALAVSLDDEAIYVEIFRDMYESFVLYSFLNLIMEYCGGESDCVYHMENEPMLKSPCPFCYSKPLPRDARLLRECNRGVIQFVIVKFTVACIDIIMLLSGIYFNYTYQIIETIVYNFSYGTALYYLYTFYLATKDVIKNFRPIAKFATVKIIIFATYYQCMLLRILLPISTKDVMIWNDLLLCFEMIIFAALLWLAFPVSEFIGGIPDRRALQNVKDVFRVKDIYHDVYHNFMPAYRDYSLQRSQGEAPEIIRLQTFFTGNLDTAALKMTERYRGRSQRICFNSLLRSAKGATLRRQLENFIHPKFTSAKVCPLTSTDATCRLHSTILNQSMLLRGVSSQRATNYNNIKHRTSPLPTREIHLAKLPPSDLPIIVYIKTEKKPIFTYRRLYESIFSKQQSNESRVNDYPKTFEGKCESSVSQDISEFV